MELPKWFRRKSPALSAHVAIGFMPADIITVTTGRDCVDALEITLDWTESCLKSTGGGAGPPIRLGPHESIHFLVTSDPWNGSHRDTNHRIVEMPFQDAAAIVIYLVWRSAPAEQDMERMAIVWQARDWLANRAPFILTGSEAEAIHKHVRDHTDANVDAVFRLRRRVRRATTRHGKRRRGKNQDQSRRTAVGSSSRTLASIAISGYRGFGTTETLTLARPDGTPGSGLTFVVGPNNAGKSSLWEAFDGIARSMRGEYSVPEPRRNKRSRDGVSFVAQWHDGSSYTVSSVRPDSSLTKGEWEPRIIVGPRTEIVPVPSRRAHFSTFGRGLALNRDWMIDGTEYSRSRASDYLHQFAGRLFKVHEDGAARNEFDNLMSEILGRDFPWTIDLAEGNHGQSYYLKVSVDDNETHSGDGLGEGITSLMYIVDALYGIEPGTLVAIDEPELSLHPKLVRRLGRVLARISANNQIVVFTHSPTLVSWDDIKAGAEIARVHRVAGQSHIAQVGRPALNEAAALHGAWRTPHTLGFDATATIFLDDGVIVVEGQEDAGLLPKAFELVGISMPADVFGWGASGSGSVEKILGLLRGLGFSQVVAVLDNNVTDHTQRLKDKFPEYMVAELPAPDIRDKPEKELSGLFDEHGTAIKEELVEETHRVLASIADYFSNAQAT